MPPADRPYRTRPLAGVDQALGEGRAREPTELLDRLRERLDRLEPNHPSARPPEASADLTEPVEPAEPAETVDEVARPADSPPDSRSESPSWPKNSADQSSGYKPVDRDAGQPPPPALDPAGEPAASVSDQDRIVEISQSGLRPSNQGERYRPWFADPWSADEPGAPWFIE